MGGKTRGRRHSRGGKKLPVQAHQQPKTTEDPTSLDSSSSTALTEANPNNIKEQGKRSSFDKQEQVAKQAEPKTATNAEPIVFASKAAKEESSSPGKKGAKNQKGGKLDGNNGGSSTKSASITFENQVFEVKQPDSIDSQSNNSPINAKNVEPSQAAPGNNNVPANGTSAGSEDSQTAPPRTTRQSEASTKTTGCQCIVS